MKINITARHIELTKALSAYVNTKVQRCERYFNHIVWGQVILEVEKYRHVAEIVVHGAHTTFRAKEESTDLYAAIDLAADKLEKQLRRFKEKRKGHRGRKFSSIDPGEFFPVMTEKGKGEKSRYKITETKRFDLMPLTPAQAIKEMKSQNYKFYLFLNTKTSIINLIYLKDDGSFALIEPQM